MCLNANLVVLSHPRIYGETDYRRNATVLGNLLDLIGMAERKVLRGGGAATGPDEQAPDGEAPVPERLRLVWSDPAAGDLRLGEDDRPSAARTPRRWKIGQQVLLVGTAYKLLRLRFARRALRGASPAVAAGGGVPMRIEPGSQERKLYAEIPRSGRNTR